MDMKTGKDRKRIDESCAFEESRLPQRLVKNDRHRIGEVEAAYAGLEDRYAVGCVLPSGKEFRAEPFGFAAEDEEIPATKFRFDVIFVAMGGKILEVRGPLRLMERIEAIPILIRTQINEWPVVEAGAFEVAIRKRITEWADEMQEYFRGGRQACDGARVLRNLRPYEHDIECRFDE
jgi:hypothetical protein